MDSPKPGDIDAPPDDQSLLFYDASGESVYCIRVEYQGRGSRLLVLVVPRRSTSTSTSTSTSISISSTSTTLSTSTSPTYQLNSTQLNSTPLSTSTST